jgi:hypothetical protein
LHHSPGNKDGLVRVSGVHVLPSNVPDVSGTTTLDGLGVVVSREDLVAERGGLVSILATGVSPCISP